MSQELKEKIRKQVRQAIAEKVNNQQNKKSTSINESIVNDDRWKIISEGLHLEENTEEELAQRIKNVRMKVLDDGRMQVVFIVSPKSNQYEAIEYINGKADQVISFNSIKELENYADRLQERRFQIVQREGNITRFLKSVSRGFGRAFAATGGASLAVAVMMAFQLWPEWLAGAKAVGSALVGAGAFTASSALFGAGLVAIGAGWFVLKYTQKQPNPEEEDLRFVDHLAKIR